MNGLPVRHDVRVAALLAALALAAGGKASTARAAPSARRSSATVHFHASFAPERLGQGTTIHVGFQVQSPPGVLPVPLTQMSVLLPGGLSVSTSELGLETCRATKLEEAGPSGCPPDSPIGHGSATAVLPFGSELVFEHVAITLFSGPLQAGTPTLLVFARGEHPVLSDRVFPGMVLPASGSFGSLIEASIPPVPGLAGGPDVAVVQFATTIGPSGILYREGAHGRLITFHPEGVILPVRCPRGGFPFQLRLGFLDGTTAGARTVVSCPRASGQARHGH